MGSFDDQLDAMLLGENAAPKPVVASPEAEDGPDPNDPLAKYIGRGRAMAEEKSKFDLFLDQVAADAPADFTPEPQPYELHQWDMVTKAIYSDDNCVWLCQRCARTVSVERNETLKQAIDKNNIRDECATEVMAGVHES